MNMQHQALSQQLKQCTSSLQKEWRKTGWRDRVGVRNFQLIIKL